jgi:putative ABC transport system ATP-binding protein
MIALQNVTREFRLDEHNTITPVANVSLDIKDGEFIIVIGRSGSGKTTLLNLTAGLIKPTAGQVMIDKVDLGSMSDRQLSKLRGQKMGFIFQFPSLLPSLTVRENVNLPAIFKHRNGSQNKPDQSTRLIERLGLNGKLDVYPRQLSAGEQKRVVIARALVNQPQLVLADEPTSDLDTRTEEEVMDILRETNSTGVTFLIVTHSLQLLPFATRAFEMQNGSLNEIARK